MNRSRARLSRFPRRLGAVTITLGLCALATSTAAASGQLWWGNASSGTPGIVRSSPDGSGVTVVLPQSITGIVGPTVADPATGKLYWIRRYSDPTDPNALYRANMDGTDVTRLGSAVVPAGGLGPGDYYVTSLAIDPVTQRLYWPVSLLNGLGPVAIRWASVDDSQTGVLYDTATTPELQQNSGWSIALLVDHARNRIWWTNYYGVDAPGAADVPPIGYANLDGTGGAATLTPTCTSLSGGPDIVPNDATSMVVDYEHGYIYSQLERAWDAYGWFVGRMKLDGTDCVQIGNPLDPNSSNGKGATFDPDTHWYYDFRGSLSKTAYIDVSGPLPVVPPLPTLPLDPVGDAGTNLRAPFMLKAPHVPGGSVTITASGTTPGAAITCDCTAPDDQTALNVHRGAATTSVTWFRDGVAVPGATGTTLTATEPGVYSASFTAGNVLGQVTVPSNTVAISAPATPPEQAAAEASPAIAVVGATVVQGATLRTTVNPSVGGSVKVTASLAGRTVCTAITKAKKGGRITVTCKLTRGAKAAIRRKGAILKVTARLTDAAGKTATASRNVRVPRYRVVTPVTG